MTEIYRRQTRGCERQGEPASFKNEESEHRIQCSSHAEGRAGKVGLQNRSKQRTEVGERYEAVALTHILEPCCFPQAGLRVERRVQTPVVRAHVEHIVPEFVRAKRRWR